jgi:hypothetical protein
VLQSASQITTINLGDGEDTLLLESNTTGAQVIIHAGAGNDAITVNSVGDQSTTTISGGDGDDSVTVMGAHIPVDASVTASGNEPSILPGDTLRFDPQGAGYTQTGNVFQVTGKGTLTYDTFENVLKIDGPLITLVGTAPVIAEGDPLTITVNVDPQGDPAVLVGEVVWDLNGDNAFGDVLGTSVTLSWNQLRLLGIDDDGIYPFSVSATNGSGFSSRLIVPLTVTNAPPDITVAGSGQTYVNAPYQINLSAFDPGDDTVSEWRVDWGDGRTNTYGSGTSLARHTYLLPGNHPGHYG